MLVLLCKAARREQQYKSCNDSSPDHFTPPTLRDYSPDSTGTRRRHLGSKPIIRVFPQQSRVTAYPEAPNRKLLLDQQMSEVFRPVRITNDKSACVYECCWDPLGRKTGFPDKFFGKFPAARGAGPVKLPITPFFQLCLAKNQSAGEAEWGLLTVKSRLESQLVVG
jgi:hypothetical protein